jgi:hypothetical protein
MSAAPGELIDKAALGAMEYIAEGGQGRIYRCTQLRLPDYDGALAYKEFKSQQFSASGLEAIIGVRSRLDEATRHRLDALTTWPTRLVRDGGPVVGLLMPLIKDEFVHVGRSLTGSPMRKEREIQYLFLAADRLERLGFPRVNLYQRFAICLRLAQAFEILGANNVVYGDFSAKNALYSVGPGRRDAAAILVDCDAVRVTGTMSAVPQLNSPDWEPPGDERTRLTTQTDLYKYALFVLRCLSPGSQASTARDPRRADDILDAHGQGMLRAALGSNPAARPSATAWVQYFTARLAANGPGPGTAAGTSGVGAPAAPASGTSGAGAAPAGAGTASPAPGAGAAAAGDSGGWQRSPTGEWVRVRRP